MLFPTLIRECQVLREYNDDDKHLLAQPKENCEVPWETKHGVPVNAEKREKEEERELASAFVPFFCAHSPPSFPAQTRASGNRLVAKVSKPCSWLTKLWEQNSTYDVRCSGLISDAVRLMLSRRIVAQAGTLLSHDGERSKILPLPRVLNLLVICLPRHIHYKSKNVVKVGFS